jgi:hypothetical protein
LLKAIKEKITDAAIIKRVMLMLQM